MNIIIPNKTNEYRELERKGLIQNSILFMLDVCENEFKKALTPHECYTINNENVYKPINKGL